MCSNYYFFLLLVLHFQQGRTHAEIVAATAADVEKARASRNLRRGKGKMRNRRYVTRKGPLVVYSGDSGISRAFRNIPGVELQSVESLNLLQVRCSTSCVYLIETVPLSCASSVSSVVLRRCTSRFMCW